MIGSGAVYGARLEEKEEEEEEKEEKERGGGSVGCVRWHGMCAMTRGG